MLDCHISLATEMANENRWHTYIYQLGEKELTSAKVTKGINSNGLNLIRHF